MCAFSERRKKNLRPHDTIKMVCNIHNGALLLCPDKLSRHKLQAGGWRSQKKVRLTRARERLKHGRRRARASQCDPSNAASRCRARGARCARTRSHILHYSPLFPDNFCNAKVVAAATQRGGRLAGRYRARARAPRLLYYSAVWCKTSASLMHFLAMPSSHHMCACIPYRVSHLKMHFPPLQAGCAVQKAATFGVHTIRKWSSLFHRGHFIEVVWYL